MTFVALIFLLRARGCVLVAEDRIRVEHLAPHVPGLSVLPPDLVVGLSPRHGVRRRLDGFELRALARKSGGLIDDSGAQFPSVCVERPGIPLTAERVTEAVLTAGRALRSGELTVELHDFSRSSVPPGSIEFGPLRASAGGPVYWRGAVAGAVRVPIWARVTLIYRAPIAVAKRRIEAGAIVAADDIAFEVRTVGPADPVVERLEDATGKQVLRTLEAGDPIHPRQLGSPRIVARGETVRVDVESGAMKLTLEAKAETAGRAGDPILLRNPSSGQRFQAVVTGPGRTEVKHHAAR